MIHLKLQNLTLRASNSSELMKIFEYAIHDSHTVGQIDRIHQKVLFCHKSAIFSTYDTFKTEKLDVKSPQW